MPWLLQVQHIVTVPDPNPMPEPELLDPVLPRISKLLAGLDADGDGVASRKDLLLAFRRDRQLADHLKMQPRVKVCSYQWRQNTSTASQPSTDPLHSAECWMCQTSCPAS